MLEATDRIGGRVKTDQVNGYRLDHGFQVLLTAYPEARQWLAYSKLDLRAFLPGAMLLYPDGRKGMLGDPLRSFSTLLPTLFSRAGNIKDKFLILKLKNRLAGLTIEKIFQQEERPTLDVLGEEYGFSSGMIDHFFGPFFAGIFLEKELTTSRRMFDFVFKMFSEAVTAIPNLGMEQIPRLLAEPLPSGSIHTHAKVIKIDKQTVQLADGSTFTAPHIILATEATGLVRELAAVKTRHQETIHLHFVASEPPVEKPLIALNTEKKRLVNNLCTINTIAPAYAPADRYLISAALVGKPGIPEHKLAKSVQQEMQKWFGKSTLDWEHLHTRSIVYALPDQSRVTHTLPNEKYQVRKGLYVCGDFLLNGSINAAMKTGREVGSWVRERI